MEMNESTGASKIDFDSWAATPIRARQLLLSLRLIAASGELIDHLLNETKKSPEKYLQLPNRLSELIASLYELAERARSHLSAGNDSSLPAASREALLALPRIASAAAPVQHLLSDSDENLIGDLKADQTVGLAVREIICALRAAANSVDLFYTLLARLDDDPNSASEKFVALRYEVEKKLERWGSPEVHEHADKVFDRVSQRIEVQHEIHNLNAYCCGVAWKVLREYERQPDHAEILVNLSGEDPRKKELEKEEETANERRLACMRECMAQLAVETRWLINEYAKPDRKKEERVKARRDLAAHLGISQQQLINRVDTIREGLDRCVESRMKKIVNEAAQ
jgi:hypothetical protein